MILELIEGETIDDKLKNGPLPFEVVFRVIDDVLGALVYAHQHGVTHRDIKPGNIMVTSYGVTKLTDLGIARAASEVTITATNSVVGSLHFMAPEQIRSSISDARSDVYSVGVNFHKMLTGRLPVDGATVFELMDAHQSGPPIPLMQLAPSLSPEISAVVMKSLEKSPGARYPSAGAFRSALRDAFFGTPATMTTAAPPPPPIPAPAASPSVLASADLQRVEKHLAAAIGPIAKPLVEKAAPRHQTIPTLCEDLARHIPDPSARAQFLRHFGASSDSGRSSRTPSSSAASASAEPINEAALAAARKALAEYLGPMAGMIVARAAKGAASAEELRDAIAAEIPDEPAREAFRAQHLHGGDQAAPHAIEGSGQLRDLIASAFGQFRHVQLPEADLIGHVRQPAHRPRDGEIQSQIQHRQPQRENQRQILQQFARGVLRHLERHSHGNGNDLRA